MSVSHVAAAPDASPALAWSTPRSAAGLVAYAILEAVAEAFPKARHRRRFAVEIGEAARRLDDSAYRSRQMGHEAVEAAQARGEAAAALHNALGARQAVLARLPLAQLHGSAVRPLRAPRSGAEAVLAVSTPAAARKRLTRALDALSGLHEQLLSLAGDLNAALDQIEGDPDLEPGCDDDANVSGYYSTGGRMLIVIDDVEYDPADDEPELGSQEGGPGGTRWDNRPTWYCPDGDYVPCRYPLDGEVECEDEGAQCDDEGAAHHR